MNNTPQRIVELLTELNANMEGLRLEIERWRVHTSSSGSFVLDVLNTQIATIREIREKLK